MASSPSMIYAQFKIAIYWLSDENRRFATSHQHSIEWLSRGYGWKVWNFGLGDDAQTLCNSAGLLACSREN